MPPSPTSTGSGWTTRSGPSRPTVWAASGAPSPPGSSPPRSSRPSASRGSSTAVASTSSGCRPWGSWPPEASSSSRRWWSSRFSRQLSASGSSPTRSSTASTSTSTVSTDTRTSSPPTRTGTAATPPTRWRGRPKERRRTKDNRTRPGPRSRPELGPGERVFGVLPHDDRARPGEDGEHVESTDNPGHGARQQRRNSLRRPGGTTQRMAGTARRAREHEGRLGGSYTRPDQLHPHHSDQRGTRLRTRADGPPRRPQHQNRYRAPEAEGRYLRVSRLPHRRNPPPQTRRHLF